MKMFTWFVLIVLTAGFLAPGLNQALAQEQGKQAKVKANLAKLSQEDRQLAEEQKWCAIEDDHLLGSMGKPYKVMVKGQPVFLCCKGCEKEAKAEPDKTLAKVKELKEKAKAEVK
jgi:hypothetical protein